jgi:hypothetical protein
MPLPAIQRGSLHDKGPQARILARSAPTTVEFA